MRKAILVAMALAILFLFAGCGSGEQNGTVTPQELENHRALKEKRG